MPAFNRFDLAAEIIEQVQDLVHTEFSGSRMPPSGSDLGLPS
jgi:hypothetical protein